MPLTIEDGTGVASANSYVDAAEARAYALARGVTLSATDSVVEALLVKACDFLETLEGQYKGDRVAPAQALAWPRDEVYLFESEEEFDPATIPDQLKRAQCQLAIDAQTIALLPTSSGKEVIRKKIDVIETEYAPTGQAVDLPILTAALGILAPLLRSGYGGLRTLRV